MKGKVRRLFPGGNTSQGFYSYYSYILGQQEATAIICLKGGPGTGKSSFMKDIGKYFNDKGEDVDYFHCSSDPQSLDGVLLRKRKIAIVDGTSPHIVDPVNPGAVDVIINLGDFWEGDVIRKYKSHIMQSNRKIKTCFSSAYNNLRAASQLMDTLENLYMESMLPGEMYMDSARLINRELSKYPVTLAEGRVRKYFASAITPEGTVNHVSSLIDGYGKVYCFNAPVGLRASAVLKIISDHAAHRGFAVEEYYCPMKPDNAIEHLLIPEADLAFITMNQYHDTGLCGFDGEVINLDMREYVDWNKIETYEEIFRWCESEIGELIGKAVEFIRMAKAEHDRLEAYYVPNMNFQKIEGLKSEIIGKIERNVL